MYVSGKLLEPPVEHSRRKHPGLMIILRETIPLIQSGQNQNPHNTKCVEAPRKLQQTTTNCSQLQMCLEHFSSLSEIPFWQKKQRTLNPPTCDSHVSTNHVIFFFFGKMTQLHISQHCASKMADKCSVPHTIRPGLNLLSLALLRFQHCNARDLFFSSFANWRWKQPLGIVSKFFRNILGNRTVSVLQCKATQFPKRMRWNALTTQCDVEVCVN